MDRSHQIHIDQDTSEKNSSEKETKDRQVLPVETDKLKSRVRAFTGAFVVMISPVLLGIVLKKVNLAAAGKYQGIRRLEIFFNFVQGSFAHLAAATLQMGTLPFLCVMISEACASFAPLRYVAPRLLIASKVLVFISNISLMVLGCGILLLIHKKAWLVLSLCSIMVIIVIVVHIIWFRHRSCCVNIGGTATQDDADKYHSRLEHLLELSAGITVMMFLVLECVALEGLLRNSQGQAGFLPQVSSQETFLGATLIISFFTSASGVLLMNIWTTPLVVSNSVVLSTAFVRGLNFCLQAMPIAVVVILITLDVLPHKWKYELVWLPLFPTFTVFLVWLARRSLCLPQQQRNQEGRQAGAVVGGGPATGGSSTSSDLDKAQQPEEPEDQKPAPLELTKVAFTGFLAVAIHNVTNASVGKPCIFFVLFTAAAVLLGLSWRLLTHEAKSEAVLKAANHASFFAHTFISLAGIAFWVMAVNASK